MNQEIEDLKTKIQELYLDPNYDPSTKDTFKRFNASDENIKEIEDELNLKLPDDYKWWLKYCNYEGFYGFEPTAYIPKENRPDCSDVIENTRDLRAVIKIWRKSKRMKKYKDPTPYLVVLESSDEWWMCLDTSRIKDGICPVILYEPNALWNFDDIFPTDLPSSLHFFHQSMVEAKERRENPGEPLKVISVERDGMVFRYE